jgi:hypothetical protein
MKNERILVIFGFKIIKMMCFRFRGLIKTRLGN